MEYFLQIASNTIILAALYSLLALGFNLIYSTNKFFDLSYAAYTVLGAYLYIVLSKFHLGIAITFLLSLGICALFAFIVEKYLYVPLRGNKSSGAVMMIASLGVLTVVQAVIALIFTSNVQTLGAGGTTISFFGVVITQVQLALIAFSVVAYALCYALLARTTLGVQIRAVADNEELATTSLLPVANIRVITTIAGAALAALAAILYGMDTSVDPNIGMQLLLKGIVVAIAGGLGNMMYGIVGALFLATAENLVIWYIGGEWKDAVAFLILIVILLWRPTGILKK